jgi:hypothetical protein
MRREQAVRFLQRPCKPISKGENAKVDEDFAQAKRLEFTPASGQSEHNKGK